MFALELRAADVHAVMGRLLDQIRLADIPLISIEARAEDGEYAVLARLGTDDREAAERLGRRARTIVGVVELEVSRERPALSQPRIVGELAWA